MSAVSGAALPPETGDEFQPQRLSGGGDAGRILERVEGDEGGSRFFFASGPSQGPGDYSRGRRSGSIPRGIEFVCPRASGSRFAEDKRNTGLPAGWSHVVW